jgi:hypothetical protein
MTTIDELRAKRKAAAQRDYNSFFRRGISGRWNADGTLTASDTPGTLWVRLGAIDLNDKRPATRVLNSEVPSKVNIPVILWNLDGEWDVFCLDSRRAKQLYGSALGNYAIPDLAGDLLQFTVPGRNLKPGRAGLWRDETGKLPVNIGRFDYIDTAGSKKTWIPSDANMLDIFGNRPAAVGGQNQQRWVRFALNPDATTPTLVAINGTAQSTLLPLATDGYNGIAVPTGYVLLDAVILKTGDTFSAVTEDRWEFGRVLYGKDGVPNPDPITLPTSLGPYTIPANRTLIMGGFTITGAITFSTGSHLRIA